MKGVTKVTIAGREYYRAYMCVEGLSLYIGQGQTPEEASRLYHRAYQEWHGKADTKPANRRFRTNGTPSSKATEHTGRAKVDKKGSGGSVLASLEKFETNKSERVAQLEREKLIVDSMLFSNTLGGGYLKDALCVMHEDAKGAWDLTVRDFIRYDVQRLFKGEAYVNWDRILADLYFALAGDLEWDGEVYNEEF